MTPEAEPFTYFAVTSPGALSWLGLDFLSRETKGVLADKRLYPLFQNPPPPPLAPLSFYSAHPASSCPGS